MNHNGIFHHTRISILDERIIRFEYSPSDHFSNEKTIFTAKKKEQGGEIEFHFEKDMVSFSSGKYIIRFSKDNPLRTVEIFEGEKRIYRFKPLSNSGELPLPKKTPLVFPIMDSPRLLIGEGGYERSENFFYEKDGKDLYLLLCDGDYRLLRKLYIQVTGHNEIPRLKTFGLFSSRYYPYSESSAKELIEKYRKHHIPLDNFVIDTDWRDSDINYGVGYEVNKKLFPNMERFLHYAHTKNLEIYFNDHPMPLSKKHNVLNQEEIDFRHKNLSQYLMIGLDGWWYDRNWHVSLNGISKRIPVESLGRYLYRDITKQFYQSFVLDQEVYIRPVTMSNITEIRNGKYEKIKDSKSHCVAFQWSGDIEGDAFALKKEIVNMNRCATNMLGYYSSDIGGHKDNANRYELVRWFQYGAFSPILRPHCFRHPVRPREPWVFGKAIEAIIKSYIDMRYRLVNVIYTEAYKHYQNGLGIFRPLYLNYPLDKRAYKEKTSYMLGDKILISPIASDYRLLVTKKNFVGAVYASIFDNEDCLGKAKRAYRDDAFTSPKLEIGETIRFKGKIRFRHEEELLLRHSGNVRVYLDGKEIVHDTRYYWEPRNTNIATLKGGVSYKICLEYTKIVEDETFELLHEESMDNSSKKVYLPEGEWFNLSHRNVYQGRRYLKEKYRLEEMPLFVKAGTLLMLYKNADNLSTATLKNVVYDYYPSKKEIVEDYFYEDDGKTTGYQVGLTKISPYKTAFVDGHYEIYLPKSEGELGDGIDARFALFKMHVRDKEKVVQILVDGNPVRFARHHHKKGEVPFSASEWSSDSKTAAFKFRHDLKKDTLIQIFVETK